MVSGTHFAAHKKISARIGPEFFPPTRAKQSDGSCQLVRRKQGLISDIVSDKNTKLILINIDKYRIIFIFCRSSDDLIYQYLICCPPQAQIFFSVFVFIFFPPRKTDISEINF